LRIVERLPGHQVAVRAGLHAKRLEPVGFGRGRASRGGATADIQVTYTGFSPAARAAFEAAVQSWESRLVSTRPIHVQAQWGPLGAGIRGSAGPNALYLLSDGKVYTAALAEALCDCEGSTPIEIRASFNSSFGAWYLGTDGEVPADRYDLRTVVLHELAHGLGFLASFGVTGARGGWGLVAGGTVYPMRYDLNVWSAATGGTKLTSTSMFPNPSTALKAQLTDNGVFFGGPQVTALLGRRAKLYAPSPWSPGSSVSHFDEAAFPPGGVNSLMTPFLSNGESIGDPGPLTLGLFRDIGWTTVPDDLPAIRIGNVSKPEGDSGTQTFTFALTLTGPAQVPVVVTFATGNGTAVAPSDYLAAGGTTTIAAGASTGSIAVTVKGDTAHEKKETFTVSLTKVAGATVADGQATGSIKNDD
jgi:hypothetical protein